MTQFNTLYDFYTAKGQRLPTWQERANLYSQAGLGAGYTGQANENTKLLAYLQNIKPPTEQPVASGGAHGFANEPQTTYNPAGQAISAPTIPSPATTPPPDTQTAGDIYSNLYNVDPAEQKRLDEAQAVAEQAYTAGAPIEGDIRKATTDRFQAQIDALDKAAAMRKADLERIYGIQAEIEHRPGMTQGVANAEVNAQLKSTGDPYIESLRASEEQVNADLEVKKQAILSGATEMAQTEYQNKLKAYQEGAKSVVENIKNRRTTKEANIREVVDKALNTGVDLTNPAMLTQLATSLGVSANDIVANYHKAKTVYDAEQMKAQAIADKEALVNAKTMAEISKLKFDSKSGGGGGGGLTPAQINSTVNSIAGSFDNEPIVKSYNIAQEGYQTVKTIGVNTQSPADDIAFIYAFAKIMDPNSVVREGEYNTVQKYAQTWADNFGFKAQRIYSNTNFLTADAKQKMLNALKPKVDTLTTQYKNLQSEYQRQVDDALAGKSRTITDYSKAFEQPKNETGLLKVKRKSDGAIGRIAIPEYNPNLYELIK